MLKELKMSARQLRLRIFQAAASKIDEIFG
jgi:hypothetical protein